MVSFRKLPQSDITNLRCHYMDEPLYNAIDGVCLKWEEHMRHIMLSPEEIFWHTIEYIDYIREKQEDSEKVLRELAMRLWNDLRRTYPAADDKECKLAVTLPITTLAGCLFVTQHPLYERFGRLLIQSLNETKKHREAYEALIEGYGPYEVKIADWLTDYMPSERWLSDEIAGILTASHNSLEGHFAYLMDGLSEEVAKAFDKELREVCTGSATGVVKFIREKSYNRTIDLNKWNRTSIKDRHKELSRFGLKITFSTFRKAVSNSPK